MKKEKEGSFGDVYLGEHAFNFDHSVLSVEMTRMPSKKVTIPHTTWDLSFFFFSFYFFFYVDWIIRSEFLLPPNPKQTLQLPSNFSLDT